MPQSTRSPVTAIVVSPSGFIRAENARLGLQDLQARVEGFIEIAPLQHDFADRKIVGYICEDGKMKGLRCNNIATSLCNLFGGDWIAGNIVFVPECEGALTYEQLEFICHQAGSNWPVPAHEVVTG